VKLLFDQNLSDRLVKELELPFPGSSHVRNVGLAAATDSEVWEYARLNGFTIVSKDSDFHERSVMEGFPPKIIWIRRGNCSTTMIVEIIRSHQHVIQEFDRDEQASVLVLY
jgi:predicted nuclease of predicted toxin-antitoxin system